MYLLPKTFSKVAVILLLALTYVAGIENSFAEGETVQKRSFVNIASGGVTGVYYPAGSAMCRLINRNSKTHGTRCTVESTGGSIYNLNALRSQDVDIGIIQTDTEFAAYKGLHPFASQGPNENLRFLFSLHTEAFTVVARKDANIHTFDDLLGKRINVGNPGSGNRSTMEMVMEAKGWTEKSFKLMSELKSSEQAQALCDNNIDAAIYSYGHPNGAILEAAASCDVVLVPVEGPDIEHLLKTHPYFTETTIPGGIYTGTPSEIKTFGVKAVVVSSTDVKADIIYEVMKAILNNLDYFRGLHPLFSTLDLESMSHDGQLVPYHEGARRYYEEKELL